MTSLMKAKMDEVYKLLSEHKWKTVFNVISDKYKCGICKNLLINAHQTFCGCNFCYECISHYIENGAEICPGNTEECKLENNLKNIMINYGLNIEILKLVVICPNQMCFHECQLINFGEHLKNCSNTLSNCPFDCVGCAHKPMKSGKINEHILSEINKHSTLLIDFIKNLKNDIEELKVKEECNRLEIEKLKENDRTKDMKIESLKTFIKSIKKENKALREQMDIGDRNLWIKFDEICNTMKEKSNNDAIDSIDNEIKLLKIEKEKLLQQIKSIKNYIDEKFINEIRNEWNEKLNKTLKSIKQENNESQSNIISRISEIDKFLNMRHCGVLWWHIGKINNIGLIWSECFYDKKNPYKMKLELRNESGNLNFFLIINSSAFDEDLNWPCKVHVVIVFYALNDYQRKKSFHETRSIGKPKKSYAEHSSAIKLPRSFFNCYEFANQEQFSVKCFIDIL